MTKKYASIPNWLYNSLKITDEMDKTCFKMHDHDYGNAGYTCCGWKRAETRLEADENLRSRLKEKGLNSISAQIVFLGCRLFCYGKWRTNSN